MQVSVRDLKNRLSEHLRRVQRGERIVVTDRGRPIAEISAIEDEELSAEERLQRLAERGEVTLPDSARFDDVRPIAVRGRPVSETLLEDRG